MSEPKAKPTLVDFDERLSAEQAAKDIAPELSEDYVALEFVERNIDAVRFDHTKKRWHVWSGNRWKRDATAVAFAWTRSLVRGLASNQKSAGDRRRLGSLKFADGVERFARTDQRIAVTHDHWDRNIEVLGTPGGIVDLRTGELFAPAPELFITRSTAVDPDDIADCLRWLQFINQVTAGDAALRRFLQQWAGYCLTGETREQKLAFILGPGGTGKSTFAATLRGIMGDYAISAAMETFADAKFEQHPEQIARLDGMRMVVASETEAGHKWRANRVKLLTGGDAVTARHLFENSFDFRPKFKLTFLGNHAPAITNLETAIQRRFLVVPFNHKPVEPDLRLDDILAREWPGILRWMIKGAVDWYEHGLMVPKAISEATTQYFDEQDVFRQWLEEACEVDPKNEHLMEKSVDLFGSWSLFAKAHGEVAGTQATFNENLRFRGFEVKAIKALGTKGCRRIRLKIQPHWSDES
ncbi:putative DNA primase/helicase [Bradyrhizobium sp. AZCC 2262]|uniref:phage/plasmid primase, P4 family n=1 Tax=Bradyrhizobium sp. AZCC 2262 TaxID=3117022 RepID=UPI002FF23E4B